MTDEERKDTDAEGAARRATDDEADTEGHGLLADTDYYLQRRIGRDAELEREARQRRQEKEARPNKPER